MKMLAQRLATLVILPFLFLLVALAPARAQETGGDQWHFNLTPYAWLAGLHGSVATLPGLPAADVDVNFFDDILGNLNGALMLYGEARKGRFGFAADIAYTDIGTENSTSGPYFTSVDYRTKNLMISGSLYYRLLEKQTAFLDAMAGARYWSVDTSLSLKGGTLGPQQADHKEDWVDPLVGVKGRVPLGGSKFFINGFALIGGFSVGSDFMYDLNANLGYQLTDSIALTLGYRYLDVDYEQDEFKYDVAQQGPVLGFSWWF